MRSEETETYLGDGLYARFDGEYVWLYAPRDTGDHMVALDASTMRRFEDYVKALRRAGNPI